MLLSSSHQLPEILRIYPYYGNNLVRLSTLVRDKYPDLHFIDIGANIGDTVAMIRAKSQFPILCLEGDSYFFELLEINTRQFENIFCAQAYVGDSDEEVNAALDKLSGSGSLVLGRDQTNKTQLKGLSTILEDFPSFCGSKMLKIDTDGFDCKIIRGALPLLSAMKPVVFFEYDPYYLAQQDDPGRDIFNLLEAVGYQSFLVYDNRGDFLVSGLLSQEDLIDEIHLYFSGRGGDSYCDICAFHAEDEDLFQTARNREIEFRTRVASGKAEAPIVAGDAA